MSTSDYRRRKEREKTVAYILRHNVKIIARHYLANTALDERQSAYWRGYYDASKGCLSLLGMEQTKLEEL